LEFEQPRACAEAAFRARMKFFNTANARGVPVQMPSRTNGSGPTITAEPPVTASRSHPIIGMRRGRGCGTESRR
jgi:hypothetical protein